MMHMRCHELIRKLQKPVGLIALCMQVAEILVTSLVVQCMRDVPSTMKPLTTPCCLSAVMTEPHWGELALTSAETKIMEACEPF